MSMFRFGRKAGSNKSFEPRGLTRQSISIVQKEVHLGNHQPTDHFAPAAGTFIAAEQLYDNRRKPAPKRKVRAER